MSVPEDDAPNPAHFAPGTFGCHEALHMANFLQEMVEQGLYTHPAITQNPRWVELVDKALDALATLYTEIGVTHHHATEKEPLP